MLLSLPVPDPVVSGQLLLAFAPLLPNMYIDRYYHMFLFVICQSFLRHYFTKNVTIQHPIRKKNPAAAILLQNSLQQDYRIDQIFCVWHGRIPQHIPYRSALRNPALLQDQNAVTHIADHGDVV